jgi:hypothetical protein
LLYTSWLPVAIGIDECDLDLEKIRNGRAGFLEQGFYQVEGVGRLLPDVARPAGATGPQVYTRIGVRPFINLTGTLIVTQGQTLGRRGEAWQNCGRFCS